MTKLTTIFRRLPERTLHNINKFVGIHIFTFGLMAVFGRFLVHCNIYRVEWLFTWNIREDIGMSAVTGVLLMLVSFMFYLYDIRISRRDEKKEE